MPIDILKNKELSIKIKYKEIQNGTKEKRENEQNKFITKLKNEGYNLLNDLKNYDYRTSNEQDELDKIENFIYEKILML